MDQLALRKLEERAVKCWLFVMELNEELHLTAEMPEASVRQATYYSGSRDNGRRMKTMDHFS